MRLAAPQTDRLLPTQSRCFAFAYSRRVRLRTLGPVRGRSAMGSYSNTERTKQIQEERELSKLHSNALLLFASSEKLRVD